MDQNILNVPFSLISVIITILIGLFGAILTWYLNERSKRSFEEYKRKEERYTELIKSLKGFYSTDFDENKKLRDEFINQVNLCWLYCPDDVILKAYNFLEKVHKGKKYSQKQKEKALGEFILAIRNDLINMKKIKETKLDPEDFRHLKAN